MPSGASSSIVGSGIVALIVPRDAPPTRPPGAPRGGGLYSGFSAASSSCAGADDLVARIGRLAARIGRYIRGPFLTLGSHRAVQSEPRSPSSHPEAAAQSDELGRL